jgi:uncharacterized protein (TIGR02246 family)
MNTLPPDVDAMFDVYRNAVAARDVDAFMTQYDPDVRVFDTFGVWSYEGVAAWRGMVEQWFGSLGSDETIEIRFDDVRVAAGADIALVAAFVGYASIRNGEQKHAMQNRLTWVMVSTNDNWKIIHEHTSVPVGFEDFKGMVKRPA